MESGEAVWADRVQCALAALAAMGTSPATPQALKEMVAARFAAYFEEQDRLFHDKVPQWQVRVDDAVDALVNAKLVARRPGTTQAGTATASGQQEAAETLELTRAGARGVDAACGRVNVTAQPLGDVRTLQAPESGSHKNDPVIAGVLTPPLRQKIADDPRPRGPGATPTRWPVMIELNLRFAGGVGAAMKRVEHLWNLVEGYERPLPLADQYAVGELTSDQLEGVITADMAAGDWPMRAVYRIWPDFDTHPQIDVSSMTIKAQAAQRSFNSFGSGIVWAVVDSGIAGDHPHFAGYHTLDHPTVAGLHRDFTSGSDDPQLALVDHDGHGTHVAGIIAGGLEKWQPDPDRPDAERKVIATEKRFNAGSPDGDFPVLQPRDVADVDKLAGMAPHAKLVSLKVLAEGTWTTRVSRVMRALAYVRETNATSIKVPLIHGVNLSLGYEFAADWYACGQSPLCIEVDKLVRSGVVVVVAAGNTGYVTLNPMFAPDVVRFSAAITINDPGNAERAITVGSTHRDSPHTFGVSYFSSRGPTGDGRRKPDLVAPGERITSAAAGKNLLAVHAAYPQGIEGAAVYVEDSGTSMAAPHVSGAIAAFLSVQRELIGNPEEIKRIIVGSATSLDREPAFQGAGLLDLMRALQSV